MKTRRNWIWFFIKLLPLFMFCVFIFGYFKIYDGSGAEGNFSNYILNFGTNISRYFSFNVVSNPLITIIARMLDVTINNLNESFPIIVTIIRYVSYLVFVEILRIMFEVLVFLPKFANSFFERKLGD